MNGKWKLLSLLWLITEEVIFCRKGEKKRLHTFLCTAVSVAALEKHKAADWQWVKFISCAHNGWKWACNTEIIM